MHQKNKPTAGKEHSQLSIIEIIKMLFKVIIVNSRNKFSIKIIMSMIKKTIFQINSQLIKKMTAR